MKYNDFGLFRVSTTIAGGAYPISESTVRIEGSDENNSDINYSLLTDEDGLTPAVKLPTPPKEYSLSSNAREIPYSTYNVTVIKNGYYTKKILDVAIFAGINTTLPVNMIPYVSYEDGGSYPRGNINSIVIENDKL